VRNILLTFILLFSVLIVTAANVNAGGFFIPDTDNGQFQLIGYYDLRDRESFIQITNTDTDSKNIHIQLFNVGDNCNENNFFDGYTPNDTHVYNIRDIVTNDGNPAGFVLPENAYGIFVATQVLNRSRTLIGNLRIEDNSGYEYRTNLNNRTTITTGTEETWFNYNSENGVILSDIIGITLLDTGIVSPPAEVIAADIINVSISFDIDIYDLNEVPFSCRNVIFACTDQDNPLLETLLETKGDASVASFEYGINESIPSSKNAPLLCPNNNIADGLVNLSLIEFPDDGFDGFFTLFVGLNNGNGRGSMDSLWYFGLGDVS